MKRSLLLIFALVCTFAVKAQSLDYLTVRTIEGTEQSFSLDQLKLTFVDGKVVATGSHEELLTSSEPYRKLIRKQMEDVVSM
mgnify:CR=1 FL=1